VVIHPPRRTLREIWCQHRRYRRGHLQLPARYGEHLGRQHSKGFKEAVVTSRHLQPMVDVLRATKRGSLREPAVIARCLFASAVVVGARFLETARHLVVRRSNSKVG
jgi:hypothetical protein